MMTTTIEARLRRLEDEQDILKTLYAYGHSIDYGLEADLFVAVPELVVAL